MNILLECNKARSIDLNSVYPRIRPVLVACFIRILHPRSKIAWIKCNIANLIWKKSNRSSERYITTVASMNHKWIKSLESDRDLLSALPPFIINCNLVPCPWFPPSLSGPGPFRPGLSSGPSPSSSFVCSPSILSACWWGITPADCSLVSFDTGPVKSIVQTDYSHSFK
jgi:hypothetical protein